MLELWQTQPHCQELSEEEAKAGKLDTLGTLGQLCADELKLTQTPISLVFCSGGHLVPGTANGVEISFLVDTGAGVSLLHEDQWKKSDPK